MHPHGVTPAPQSSNVWPPDSVSSAHSESLSHASIWNYPTTSSHVIRCLSVGRIEPPTLIDNLMLDQSAFAISITRDYRELWVRSKHELIQIALLHNSLCSFELVEAARLIRIRWPDAKILIIRSGEVSLERNLYDDRLHPPVPPDVLAERISELANEFREGGHSSGNR